MNRRYLLSKSISILITKLVLTLIKFSISVITARFLGAAGRGLYFGANQFSGLISTIFSFSAHDGIIFHAAKKGIKKKDSLSLALLLVAFFSLISIGLIFIFWNLFIVPYLGEDYDTIKIFIILLIPFLLFELFSSSVLKGFSDFHSLNKIQVRSKLILAISIFTLLSLHKTLISAFIGSILAYIFISFVYIAYFLRNYGFAYNSVLLNARKVLSYGKKMHFPYMLYELEHRVDLFIILYLLSPASLGVYSIGILFAQIVLNISNSFNTVLFTKFSDLGNSKELNIKSMMYAIRNTIFLSLIFYVFFAFFGTSIIDLLFGEEFHDAYFVFLFISFGVVFDLIARGLSTYLKTELEGKLISKVLIFTLTVNICLNFLLIPALGVSGAAIASSISYLGKAYIYFLFFKKKFEINFIDFFKFNFQELNEILKVLFNKIFTK